MSALEWFGVFSLTILLICFVVLPFVALFLRALPG